MIVEGEVIPPFRQFLKTQQLCKLQKWNCQYIFRNCLVVDDAVAGNAVAMELHLCSFSLYSISLGSKLVKIKVVIQIYITEDFDKRLTLSTISKDIENVIPFCFYH